MTNLHPTVDSTQKVSLLTGKPIYNGVSQTSLPTYNADGTPMTSLKGGYVYIFYLPDAILLPDNVTKVSVLDQLKNSSTYSVRVYVKVTSTMGSTVLSNTDFLDIKKQQLFQLS